MQTHTPGPWRVQVSEYGFTEVLAQTKRGLWKAVCRVGGFFRADRENNACLISAAPELLDALKSLVFSHSDIDSEGRKVIRLSPDDHLRITAAIRKAEGK